MNKKNIQEIWKLKKKNSNLQKKNEADRSL